MGQIRPREPQKGAKLGENGQNQALKPQKMSQNGLNQAQNRKSTRNIHISSGVRADCVTFLPIYSG